VIDAVGANASTLMLAEQALPAVPLTRREWDVMRCIAAGRSTEETARLLFVEPSTVRKHLEHVYGKLGVGSRTAALAKLGSRLAHPSATEAAPPWGR
jgi:DNA-binding CsgD family transcriptional regulator